MLLTPADLQAIGLTLKVATLTTAILLLLGVPLAWWLARTRSWLKTPLATVVALPIVLPPSVLGFYLLVLMGPNGPVGQWTQALGLGTGDLELGFAEAHPTDARRADTAADQVVRNRLRALFRQALVGCGRTDGVGVAVHVDEAVRILLQARRDAVEQRLEAGAYRIAAGREGNAVGQVDEDGTVDFAHVDARPCGLVAKLANLLVHPVADHAADRAAAHCTDNTAGLAADQAAEKRTRGSAAQTADSGARNLLLAGVGIGDARRNGQHGKHGKAGSNLARNLHGKSPLFWFVQRRRPCRSAPEGERAQPAPRSL